MKHLSFAHGRAAYRADFLRHGATKASLVVLLIAVGPGGQGAALAGLLGWSLIEYGLHRFVLHGLAPLHRWHEQNHERPTVLTCTPTPLSGILNGLFA
jgi:cyclopropane-fatty-acyl-phospholipid synthase